MDIVVKGRHTEVPERFRRHVAEKLARVEKHDHRVIRIDVEAGLGVHEHRQATTEQLLVIDDDDPDGLRGRA